MHKAGTWGSFSHYSSADQTKVLCLALGSMEPRESWKSLEGFLGRAMEMTERFRGHNAWLHGFSHSFRRGLLCCLTFSPPTGCSLCQELCSPASHPPSWTILRPQAVPHFFRTLPLTPWPLIPAAAPSQHPNIAGLIPTPSRAGSSKAKDHVQFAHCSLPSA